MSHSNPKVLFTFQFGSRIVPVLREQDLRKSPASIAFQPANHFSPSLSYCLVLYAVIGCLATVGCWKSLVFSVLWPPWMWQHLILSVQQALGCKRITLIFVFLNFFVCVCITKSYREDTNHACMPIASCFFSSFFSPFFLLVFSLHAC